MVMENPCNPWSKCFAAGEQSRLLPGREKMLGKVSLRSLWLNGARFHCLVTALPRILPEGMSALTVR